MKLSVKAGILSLLAMFVCSTAGGVQAKDVQKKPVPQKQTEPWWKHAVIYEIYPRSFADADNNGMGDIKGITQKLDYLHDLGVDALWITPCYPSPQVDFGYDISDYCDIAPEYGTLADFDELIKEAKKRNIRIVMDFVMNHCSDKHKWFVESSSSRTNPKRNWFIWRDPKNGPLPKNSSGAEDPKSPPNNWQSLFGHSAWKWDPKTNQYYYHFFYPEQPDLNWHNGQVKKAMYDAARFWLDRGVAGFRLDAINTLYEDPGLKDNPTKPGKNKFGDLIMEDKNNYLLLSEIKGTMRELRKVLDGYSDNPVLLGETTAEKIEQLVAAYGKNNDEIQLPMDFRFAYINKLSAPEFRKKIAEIDQNEVDGQPTYVLSNHDITRHYVRYGDGKNNDQIAKLTATLLLTTRGTPVMYYGEELGMENRDPERKEDVQDPIGIIGWPNEKGRDGERTPMQWDAGKNAGFSTVKPWLPVTESFKTHNVEVENRDPDSILNFYKQLLSLRKKNAAMKYGKYVALNEDDDHVVSYLRKRGGAAALVACNMSSQPRKVTLNLQQNGITATEAKVLLASYSAPDSISTTSFTLPPFAVLIADVSRPTK